MTGNLDADEMPSSVSRPSWPAVRYMYVPSSAVAVGVPGSFLNLSPGSRSPNDAIAPLQGESGMREKNPVRTSPLLVLSATPPVSLSARAGAAWKSVQTPDLVPRDLLAFACRLFEVCFSCKKNKKNAPNGSWPRDKHA